MKLLWLETWLRQHPGKVLVCLVLALRIQQGPQACQGTSTTGPHSLLSILYLGVGVHVCVCVCCTCVYLCDCRHIHVFGGMCLWRPEDNLSYHSSGTPSTFVSVYMWVGVYCIYVSGLCGHMPEGVCLCGDQKLISGVFFRQPLPPFLRQSLTDPGTHQFH